MENAKQKSPFVLWLENYWYHYKWRTLLGIFLAVLLTVGCVQCASREKYDVETVFYMDDVVSDMVVGVLQSELDKYVPDLDGDGEAKCHVANVAYDHTSLKTVDLSTANSSLLVNSISNGDIALYIVDEYGYNFLMTEKFALFEQFDFMPDKDSRAWCWKDSKFRQSLLDQGINLPKNLYFCIRRVAGTTVESESALKVQDEAVKIVKKLINE